MHLKYVVSSDMLPLFNVYLSIMFNIALFFSCYSLAMAVGKLVAAFGYALGVGREHLCEGM